MQLSSLRIDWTPSRTWFVTARLLEVAAAVAVLGAGLLSWQMFESTSQMFGPDGASITDGTPFLDRVAQFGIYGLGYGQAPVSGIVACLLLLAVVAVLHLARPVSHASLLRWEAFSVWVVATLLNLVVLAAVVVAVVRGDPNSPEETPGTITIDTGPSFVDVLASGATLPVLDLLLLSVSALWWLRLPVEFEAPEDEPAHEPRRWRPPPAPDANVDDLTLDGVEMIEPVERLHPRDGDDDGSTASGYDDYFRRF